MPLFLFEHHHQAENCPTQNREMMMQLVQHTSQATADQFGIRIHSEAVLPGEHTLLMVLEAESADKVLQYLQPFLMIGAVSMKPVLTCEQVAQRACD